jgi:hypothetical protein
MGSTYRSDNPYKTRQNFHCRLARRSLLVVGAILLVLGMIMLGFGLNILYAVNICQSGPLCGLEPGPGASDVLQPLQTEGFAFAGIGGLLALFGLILVVVGAVSKGRTTAAVAQVPVQVPQAPISRDVVQSAVITT